MISVGGISSGNSVTNIFSGALRTCAGSLTTSVFALDALEQMRGGDVSEIERRVLAQQHHVEFGQLGAPRLAASVKWSPATSRTLSCSTVANTLAVEQRQPVGRVIGELVAALLRLQQQREGGIALDVDPLDRIHLHRDVERS